MEQGNNAAAGLRLPPAPIFVLMAGLILSGISFQASNFAIGDQGGGWHVSADTASWFTTAYAMAEAAALPLAPLLINACGMRRVAACAGGLAAAAALLLAVQDSPQIAVGLRAVQGAASGVIAVTMMVGVMQTIPPGPSRNLGLALFAFGSSVSTGFGASVSAWVGALGWRGLFLFDLAWTVAYVAAVLVVLPRPPMRPKILRDADWPGVLTLSAALSLLLLVLNQGERRFWWDSAMLTWTAIAAMALFGASLMLMALRPHPLLDLTLLARPTFGWAILGAVMFRFGLLVGSFVIPQVLIRLQGFRDTQIAGATLWQVAAHLAAFPLAWWIMRRGYQRVVLSAGLLCFAGSAGLAAFMAPEWQAADFRVIVLLAGAGQGFFLTATLAFATAGIAPAQGATAAVLFNLARSIGAAAARAIVGNVVSVREKLHSAVLVEAIGDGARATLERLDQLTQAIRPLSPDTAAVQALAAANLAAAVSQQSFVLAYNDAFLVIAVLLALAALLASLLPALPPELPREGTGA